jgi:hypothetical protein
MKTICEFCKKVFEGQYNWHKYKYCSHNCHSNAQIGKHTKRFDKIKRKGYWFVYLPKHHLAGKQGYVAEHRLVMEKKIGRNLNPSEIVHHLNHDITDNRIENLMLFSGTRSHLRDGHPEIAEKQRVLFKGKHFSPKTEFKKKI